MSTLQKFDWFQPQDLPALFRALRITNPPAILVGGQSLTFWMDFFDIPIPKTDTPFLTRDADIFGSQKDAKLIASELNMGHARTPEASDHTPSTGVIVYYSSGRKLMIDVMGSLCGLDNNQIVDTAITLEIPKYGQVSILHPRLVMISRISNLMVIQSKRDLNGVTQAKLSIDVYKHFLNWYRTQLTSDDEYQNFLLDKAEELKKISLSDASVFVYKQYGINVLDSFPIELVNNKSFLEIQWPNIARWFQSRVESSG